MTDLPPRFTTDLADALPAASSSRRWDDPPEHDPPPPSSQDDGDPLKTTLLLINPTPLPPAGPAEIVHLAFSPVPGSPLLLAAVPREFVSHSFKDYHMTFTSAPCHSLHFWNLGTMHGLQRYAPKGLKKLTESCSFTAGGGGINGLPAFRRGGGDADVLLAAARFELTANNISMPKLAAYDVGRGAVGREGLVGGSMIRAPMAWRGERMAAVSVRDETRVVVLRFSFVASTGMMKTGIEREVAGHLGEVKLVGFLPTGELVSAGVDGYVRVTSVEDGRTVRRIYVSARVGPGLMGVAPDGGVVVTVWGREVVVWEMGSGKVTGYNLDAVRSYECWPLCVSPDCRYLVCRTEDGLDVSDLWTGKFKGEWVWKGPLITAAAVNEESTVLAVGDCKGGIQTFEIITA